MNPIIFRGLPFSAQKKYFQGTHRIKSPEETWEKIAPMAPLIGLTRIANITGLDRIGIPVTNAIRPQALTLSVSMGKGTTLVTALVSGMMESAELYCAETASLPTIELPYRELIQQYDAIASEDLCLQKKSLFHPNLIEKWTMGWDLFHQKEVAVPLAYVSLNPQTYSYMNPFQSNSNGLASGNHFLEALISGLYEVIERDAVSCSSYASETTDYKIPTIRLETIPYPSVQKILEQFKKAAIHPILYDCSTDTQVPVFKAAIHDEKWHHIGVGVGYGAHLDPEVSMIRALTEAVQGRGAAIAGARDDLFLSFFELAKKYGGIRDFTSPTVDASSYSSEATPSLEGDIHLLMAKLKRVGINQLLVFDLSQEALDISVAQVVVPQLESYYSPCFHPRKRAQNFAAHWNKRKKRVVQENTHSPAGGMG